MRYPKANTEQEVLFNILKGNPPSELIGVDTNRLYDLFQRHRLFPIAQDIAALLPPEEKLKWKKTIQAGSLRTLRLMSQLKDTISMLSQEGIHAIPLKGPLLAHMLYGDIGQRHMRDLDLLVIHGDILKAVELMIESGFKPYIPKTDLRQKQWKYYFKHQYDVALIAKESSIIVELHAGIAYPGLLDKTSDPLISDLHEVDMLGETMTCMSRESTFLYLAIHGAHHLFFRLFWLRDFAEALLRWDLDHTLLFSEAKKHGIERMVGVSLRLAQSYFGVEPPEAWKIYLEEQNFLLNSLEKRCHRIICHSDFLSRKNRLNVLLFSLSMKSGWRHRWASLSTVFHRWYIRKFLSR